YAHRREDLQGRPLNLVHRDVSPHNILLSYEGEVKIIDFGVAKATTNRTETMDGMLKGKIAYMAPEQIRTRQVDRRVDIFALGSVLYEMLAGRRLYQGADTIELLEKVRNADLPVLEESLPYAPREIIEVLRHALAPDPERRFQSAADFAKALEPFLIYNRSIYGASEASEVVRAAFPETPNRRRDYVSPSDTEIRDLGREFAPSVVEAFDQVSPVRATQSPSYRPETPFDEEGGGWNKATTAEYNKAVETGVRMAPVTPEEVAAHASAPPAARPLPNYVEPSDSSGIHQAFDGSPPEKKSPVPALLLGVAVALVALAVGWFTLGPGASMLKGDSVASSETQAEEAPVKKDVGYVSVTTKQGKALPVFIDGEKVGKTPIELRELGLGSHQLVVAFRINGKRKETRPQIFKVGENNTRENPLKIEINDSKMPEPK
ncbi:MAG: serine/threonine-protein kinase, partial [Myxococcota bacterium]